MKKLPRKKRLHPDDQLIEMLRNECNCGTGERDDIGNQIDNRCMPIITEILGHLLFRTRTILCILLFLLGVLVTLLIDHS